MTHEEFWSWLTYHGEAFPEVAKYLEKNQDAKQHWWKALARCTPAGLRAATDALVRGEPEEPPEWPSKHRDVVRRLAKELGDSEVSRKPPERYEVDANGDRHQVFVCLHCEDSGWAFVWTAEQMEAYRRDPRRFEVGTPWALPCCCEFGRSIVPGKFGRSIVPGQRHFDPQTHRWRPRTCGRDELLASVAGPTKPRLQIAPMAEEWDPAEELADFGNLPT